MFAKAPLIISLAALVIAAAALFIAFENRATAQGISGDVYQQILDEVTAEVNTTFRMNRMAPLDKPKNFSDLTQMVIDASR